MAKSLFETLFEEVMSDEEALGISSNPEDAPMDGEGDLGESGEMEDVSITIPRDVAQNLIDVLTAALGGGMEEEPMDGEMDGEMEGAPGDVEEGAPLPEATEIEGEDGKATTQPDKTSAMTSKGNMKVGTSWSPVKKKATGEFKGQDGKASNQPDKKGTMTGKGNMKVASTNSSLAGSKKNAFED